MDKRWLAGYAVVLGLSSVACGFGGVGPGYSGVDNDYSREHTDEPPDYSNGDGYHGGEAVRQALTAPAPEVDNNGYADDDYYSYDCEVHAQCGPGQVCASDPACPDYLYCYDKQEAACDCADRFNTVCYFGDCVMRGFDCDSGCPSGTTCDSSVGACVCDSPGCQAAPAPPPEPEPAEPEEPTITAPQASGEKCFDDADCPNSSCVNGTCGAVPCWTDSDCMREESCALADDGLRYCVDI